MRQRIQVVLHGDGPVVEQYRITASKSWLCGGSAVLSAVAGRPSRCDLVTETDSDARRPEACRPSSSVTGPSQWISVR
jgi:hypothetical protein